MNFVDYNWVLSFTFVFAGVSFLFLGAVIRLESFKMQYLHTERKMRILGNCVIVLGIIFVSISFFV